MVLAMSSIRASSSRQPCRSTGQGRGVSRESCRARGGVIEPRGRDSAVAGRELCSRAPGQARHHVVVRDSNTAYLAVDTFGFRPEGTGTARQFSSRPPSPSSSTRCNCTARHGSVVLPVAIYVAHFASDKSEGFAVTCTLTTRTQLCERHVAPRERKRSDGRC